MLTLVTGDVGTGKSTHIYSCIRKDIDDMIPSFLIVPEQYTVICEKKMADILPPSAPLTFEVSNFSRLANTVFRILGGLCYNYADRTTKTLIMWRTVSELLPLLHEGGGDNGRIMKALSYVKELHSLGITPSMMSDAAKKLGKGQLVEKLEDLSLIYTLYSSFLHVEYSDAEEDPERLSDILAKNAFFAGKHLYFDSFTSFTEPQYEILTRIMPTCDVTVCLTLDSSGRKMCFSENEECLRRLTAIADKTGTEVREIKMHGNKRTESEVVKFLAENVFSRDFGSVKYTGDNDGRLKLTECENVYSECEYISSEICNGVMNGAKFGDFAVIYTGGDGYDGIIRDIFGKYGIPFFKSEKTDISSLEVIKYINSLYAVCCRNFSLEDVITYIKCDMCDIDIRDADIFEIYAEKWKISGKKFTADKDFTMNVRGYTDSVRNDDEDKLRRINYVRRRVISPVIVFGKKIGGKHSVREHTEHLVDFLLSVHTEEKTAEKAERFRSDGDVELAEIYARLWQTLCDAFDVLVNTVGDCEVSAEEYSGLLKLLFSGVNMGRIPSSQDEVCVGSADTVRVGDVSTVFLIGINDGLFPKPQITRGVFAPVEREMLRECGISVPFDETDDSRQLFSFYRAMLTPSKRLFITYARQNSGLTAQNPSFVIQRIINICGNTCNFSKDTDNHPCNTAYTVGSLIIKAARVRSEEDRKKIYSLISEKTGKKIAVPGGFESENIYIGADTANAVFGRNMKLSQAKTDTFSKCPFSYYCRYVLRLDEGGGSDFGVMEIGNFTHALLQRIFRRIADSGESIRTIDEKSAEAILDEVCLEYIGEIRPKELENSARLTHLFEYLRRTVRLIISELALEFRDSKFTPKYFELPVDGRGDAPKPLKFTLDDGTLVCMVGKIDRVDTYENGGKVYVRVIDYKTGTKKFSEEDIKKGINLQLPLYLMTLCSGNGNFFGGKKTVPAGMMYMQVSGAAAKVDSPKCSEEINEIARGELKRNGILLDDPESADGETVDNRAVSKPAATLASIEKMRQLFSDIEITIRKIGCRIKSGDAGIPAKKYLDDNDSCKYCRMGAVCRKRVARQ